MSGNYLVVQSGAEAKLPAPVKPLILSGF